MAEAIALATAVVVLATAVVTWRRVAKVERNVQEVHVLVNSQLHQLMRNMEVQRERVEQLTAALKTSDTPVPPAPADPGQGPPMEGPRS